MAIQPTSPDAEERISVATQWQLMWWRFRKHALARVGAIIVILFYSAALLAEFLAYSDPTYVEAQRSLLPPHGIQWIDEGKFAPFVYGLKGTRDPTTFKRVYVVDPTQKYPIVFFGEGFEWTLFGKTVNRHLIAVEGAPAEEVLFLLGNRHAGARSMVAPDVWHACLPVHWSLGRHDQSLSGHPAGRHFRLLRGRDRHLDPTYHRDHPFDSHHSAVDGPGRGAAQRVERQPGLLLPSRLLSRSLPGRSWRASHAAASSPCARKTM